MRIEPLLPNHKSDVDDIMAHLSKDKLASLKSWSTNRVFLPFRGRKGFVVRDHKDNSVLGFSLLQIVPDGIEVQFMASHPRKQRSGVGRVLIENTYQMLSELDFDVADPAVFLEVEKGNEKALEFYSAVGFEIVGERSHYYGEGLDALLMRYTPYYTPGIV